ncbi:hypothetical protein MRX96_000904 [Rhipicephalus microplus]
MLSSLENTAAALAKESSGAADLCCQSDLIATPRRRTRLWKAFCCGLRVVAVATACDSRFPVISAARCQESSAGGRSRGCFESVEWTVLRLPTRFADALDKLRS